MPMFLFCFVFSPNSFSFVTEWTLNESVFLNQSVNEWLNDSLIKLNIKSKIWYDNDKYNMDNKVIDRAQGAWLTGDMTSGESAILPNKQISRHGSRIKSLRVLLKLVRVL